MEQTADKGQEGHPSSIMYMYVYIYRVSYKIFCWGGGGTMRQCSPPLNLIC